MAWFGSGISQITGQISNFTKEVLTEGTEEVDDHATELRLSKSRVAEMENYCETQKAEGQRLEHLNKELAEKLEAAELQISAVSTQYREGLSQKDEEIRELKQRLNELQHLEPQLLDDSLLSPSPVAHSTLQGFGHGDEHDFDDLVTSQHEINRLRSKVQRLQAECNRWQQVHSSQATGDLHSAESNREDGNTVASLRTQVKDLQQQLASCVDQNQHELAALQDLHAQKLSAVIQRQKEEGRAHEEKVASLIQQLHESGSGSSTCGHEKELSLLKEQVRHLEEINGKLSTDLEQMHAADREKARLLAELREQLKQLEGDHAKVREEYTEMSSQRASLLAEVDALTEERQTLKMKLHDLSERQATLTTHVQSTGDVTSQSHDNVPGQSNTEQLEQQVHTLTRELDTCRREIEEFDLVKSDWGMEKEALEEVLLTMREQLTGKIWEEDGQKEGGMKGDAVLEKLEAERQNVTRLEKELQQNAVSRSQLEDAKRELEASRQETKSMKLQLQEKCAEMDELQHCLEEKEQAIRDSNEKISRLSTQLETAQVAMSDSLEHEVDKLKKQLKAKNEELMDVNVEVEELKTLVEEQIMQVEALKTRLSEQSLELETADAEKEQLSTSIDELDSQHEEAMSQVIASRQSLLRENKALQERCTTLESVQHVSETRQTSSDDTMKSGSKEEVNELKEKLEKTAMSLNELHMDKKELENETNSLKRKIVELQKKLKAGTSETTSLKQKNLELEIEVTSAREELSLLKQSVAARDDLGQLRKQFEESWNENARKEMTTELHGEIGMLKADLAAALAEKEVIAHHLDQMKTSRASNDEASSAAVSQSSLELLAQVDLLQNQNESLEKLLSDAEEKLAEIKEMYDAQIVMTEGHAVQVKHLNQLVESLSQENDVLSMQQNESKEKMQEEARIYEQEKQKNQESDAKMCSLEAKCVDLEKKVKEKMDIEQAWEESKGFIATLRVENERLLREKDNSTTLIRQQRAEIERLGTVASSGSQDTQFVDAERSSEVVNKGHEPTDDVSPQSEISKRNDQMNGRIAASDANMAELENLRKIISLKDNIVMELKGSNASLLQLLEERSMELHGNRVLVEIHELGAEVTNLRREKEQMMSVLNEKTRDCSSLKAEVHRLMSVVSAQKATLSRMQDDNNMLQKSASVPDSPVANSNNDMSREAIKQLSQVIRDKDVEMEALRQKSDTLIAVLQEQSADGAADQISTLMRERDNLAKQISVFVDDRNQIVAALNNKHEECVAYHAEAGRLAELLMNNGTEKDKLQHEYEKLTWEFENKKQVLLKAQNELVGLRQKCSKLNQLYLDLKQSGVRLDLTMTNSIDDDTSGQDGGQDMQKLMVVIENQRAAVCEKDEIITKSMTALQEKEQNLLERDQGLLERDRLLNEREKSINELRVQLHRAEEVASQKETQLSNANKQNQHSTFQLQGLQTEVVDLRSKCTQLTERNEVLQLEMNNLRETHSRVSRAISDKEFELAAAQEKINALSQLVRHDAAAGGNSSSAEVETLVREKEAVQQQVALLRQERDQLVTALQQTQVENEQLQGKISQLSEREQKLSRELDRLRNHLLAIEENYTHEALDSEEREKELRNRLAQAEERLLSSSSLVESASQQANQQVETLQQQLHVVAEQRDNAILQLANSQEMASQYATSLANLQMVLEQFQQERDVQQAADMERCQKELKAGHKELRQLKQQLRDMQEQLDEKSEALEAAGRLSEQLDRKEEMIHALREEVQLREKELTAAEEKVTALSGTKESKVDKALVKNLLIGYFHTPTGKRVEVLKLMCKVLDFNGDEMQQIGAETNSGWLGGLLRRVTPSTPTSTNKSFSQLFVNFLETESTPKPVLRLPAEAMAQEQHQRQEQRLQKHTFNPFTATATASTPTGRRASSEDSHLLMKPIAASLPLFTPIVAPAVSASRGSSGRSTPASSTTILRDVLQQ